MIDGGGFTTEHTGSTEKMLEQDPITGKVIACAIKVQSGIKTGQLINFNGQRMVDGIKRFKL